MCLCQAEFTPRQRNLFFSTTAAPNRHVATFKDACPLMCSRTKHRCAPERNTEDTGSWAETPPKSGSRQLGRKRPPRGSDPALTAPKTSITKSKNLPRLVFSYLHDRLASTPRFVCSTSTRKAPHAAAPSDSYLPAQGTSQYGGTGLPGRAHSPRCARPEDLRIDPVTSALSKRGYQRTSASSA